MNKIINRLCGFKCDTKIIFMYKNNIELDYIGNIVNNKLKIYDGINFKEGVIEEYESNIDCYKLRTLNKITNEYLDTTIYGNNINVNVLSKIGINTSGLYIPVNMLNDNYVLNNKIEYEIISVVRLYHEKYIYYNVNNNIKLYGNGINFIENNNIYNDIKMEALMNNKKN